MTRLLKRRSYLSQRVAALEKRMGENDVLIARLSQNMFSNPHVLLFEEDVAGGPPDIPPTVSEKQKARLSYQAFATLEVLKGEWERDNLQLKCTREAKDLAEKEAPVTDAAVKIAEAGVFDLLSEASVVRHTSSLIRDCGEGGEEFALERQANDDPRMGSRIPEAGRLLQA